MTMATKMTTMLRIFVEQTEIETKLDTKETNKKVRGTFVLTKLSDGLQSLTFGLIFGSSGYK